MELMGIADLINKNKSKAYNVAVVILALLIASSIYKCQVGTAQTIRGQKEIEAKKSEVLRDISALEKRINSYKDILTKKDTASIINTISNIAKESGVSLDSIRPQSEVDYPIYTEHSFILAISCDSYHAIGKFISKLEGDPAVYIVRNTKIGPKASGGREGMPDAAGLSVELTISTISFKDWVS